MMVPGCERAERLHILWEMIGELSPERQLCEKPGLIGLVESAAGLVRPNELAAFAPMIGLALGPEDLALDMGVGPGTDLLDLPARQIAVGARAYNLMALAVPVSMSRGHGVVEIERMGQRRIEQCSAGRGIALGVAEHSCRAIGETHRSNGGTTAALLRARTMLPMRSSRRRGVRSTTSGGGTSSRHWRKNPPTFL
jgi:hypothetical protein